MSGSLGVIIVTYRSQDEVINCLNSLVAANDVPRDIVVVDNASPDATCRRIEAWATQHKDALTLLKLQKNVGFAAGVNRALAELLQRPHINRFWILNPDCTCTPATPAALANWPKPFSLLGCRISYADPSDQIQIDGGTINKWTGATRNSNIGKSGLKTPAPDPSDFDFISGASMVASREFVESAGPMPEDYFLYYEEVDWAQRRGDLPLAFCPDARVYHLAGASIGSPTLSRGPSPLSVYFKHRARMRFVARYNPIGLPTAYFFGWLKLFQNLLRGELEAAASALRGFHGLPPGRAIRRLVGNPDQAATKALTADTKLS